MSIAPDPVFKQNVQYKRLESGAPQRAGLVVSAGALAKMVFDRLSAAIALVMLSPVLVIVALLIMMRRDGPVFFSHMRVGKGGKLFPCHKFRTMVPDGGKMFDQILAIDPIAREDWVVRRKVFRDPRVSRLGAFLRSSSIDELPQLWNVLVGEMSMVGPRPITVEELAKYGDNAAEYLSVRPGITGAWQVSGRSECTYAERVALDVDYVRNFSFGRDMNILMRTFEVVLRRQGAV